MLSIKERRFCLEYVKNPEQRPSEILHKISHKPLTNSTASTRAKKYLKSPEVQEYIEQLQGQVAKALNLNQLKQIKKLQKIYKAGMKTKVDANGNKVPINLASSVSALATINNMTGLDQVQKQKIDIDTSSINYDDANYGEKLVMQLAQQFMNRTIDREDLDSLLKTIDTLTAYRIGAKVEEQLIEQPKSKSLFNKKDK